MSSNEQTSTHLHLDWDRNWDPEAGLWWHDAPGHTASVADRKRVHCGPEAAYRLLVAAQADALGSVDVTAVLGALRGTQLKDGHPGRGGFPWYVEEENVSDGHASFFNGLPLCALCGAYGDRLSPSDQTQLLDILAELRVAALRHVGRHGIHYPNEYLGDWVCAWLAGELTGVTDDDAMLLEGVRDAAEYWLDHCWGWGEHLSDSYGSICLDELSLVLLMAKRLPEVTRDCLLQLLGELLAINDQFSPGPRVPAIRNYAFKRVPTGLDYRRHVQPLPRDATLQQDDGLGQRLPTCSALHRTASGSTWLPLGHTLHELGWHDIVPSEAARRPSVTVPCVGGAKAIAHVEEEVRLGSLSRFPLMPTAEHPTWGLSWQCFPVALWRPQSAWGYFQWETLEEGIRRSHPAQEKYRAYLGNALTMGVRPPIVGWTYAIQHEGELVAMRVMPMIAASWDELLDRFRLVGQRDGVEVRQSDGCWSQLVLDCGPRTISVQSVSLSGGPAPELVRASEDIHDWQVRCPRNELTKRRALVTLWGISLSGPVIEAPTIEPDPEAPPMPRGHESLALRIRWQWPNRTWRLKIDLTEAEPLQEVV